MLSTKVAALLVAMAGRLHTISAAPSGFSEKRIFGKSFMTDIAFNSQDYMFVTQKIGRIHVHEPGDNYEYDVDTEALDISDMVCYENERGLGGIQLHPNFDTNNVL